MPTIDDLSTAQKHLIHVAATRLEEKFQGVFAPETIERYIKDSLDQLLPNSEVVTFVPIFVERFARDRLKALAVKARSQQGPLRRRERALPILHAECWTHALFTIDWRRTEAQLVSQFRVRDDE